MKVQRPVPGPSDAGAGNATAPLRRRLAGGDLGLLPVVLGLLLIWSVFQLVNENFLSPRNLSNLIVQIVEIGLLGVGETLILLLGEIDLAMAAVSGVAAGVLVYSMTTWNFGPWLAILAALAVGALFGALQGYWVTVVGVPSFIVTLGGQLLAQGLLLAMLGIQGTVPIVHPTILAIASSYLPLWLGWLIAALTVLAFLASALSRRRARLQRGLPALSRSAILLEGAGVAVLAAVVVGVLDAYRGVPLAGVVLLAVVAIFTFLTQSTPFGRHIYAVGGNAEAARRAGIDVRKVRLLVFILASTLGAAGGIVGASRLGSASPGAGGGNLLLDAIATAVIGGTSLFGGRGSVVNALLGALVIGSVENGMDLLSAPSSTKYIVEGVVLLAAVTLDTVSRQRRMASGRG